jgi:DNA-binding FadR family transcriptional regulator
LARSLSRLRPAARLRVVQDEHIAIVKGIEARNSVQARSQMESHIQNARMRVFEGAPGDSAIVQNMD